MTNVQADIQVDAGNNAWLLTLPEVRIEGELFEECTVVALRTLKDSWYHPDGGIIPVPVRWPAANVR